MSLSLCLGTNLSFFFKQTSLCFGTFQLVFVSLPWNKLVFCLVLKQTILFLCHGTNFSLPLSRNKLDFTLEHCSLSEYLVPNVGPGVPLEEPVCRGDLPASMHTLDHLAGIRHRSLLPHFPEMGLREALQTLTDRSPISVDQMATRIARSLVKVR